MITIEDIDNMKCISLDNGNVKEVARLMKMKKIRLRKNRVLSYGEKKIISTICGKL